MGHLPVEVQGELLFQVGGADLEAWRQTRLDDLQELFGIEDTSLDVGGSCCKQCDHFHIDRCVHLQEGIGTLGTQDQPSALELNEPCPVENSPSLWRCQKNQIGD